MSEQGSKNKDTNGRSEDEIKLDLINGGFD